MSPSADRVHARAPSLCLSTCLQAAGASSSARAAKASRSGARRPRAANPEGEEEEGEEGDEEEETESRLAYIAVGDDYQAKVPAELAPRTCHERGDTLIWSASAFSSAVEGEVLERYLEGALSLVGGAVQNPPTQSSAQERFPLEIAMMALHEAGGDPAAATAALAKGGLTKGEVSWSKVEERHFRAALAREPTKRHDPDLGVVREAVKTKDLKAVIRFFYVEDGAR